MKVISRLKYDFKTELWSCDCGFQLTWKERWKLFITGKLWRMLTENEALKEQQKLVEKVKLSLDRMPPFQGESTIVYVQEEKSYDSRRSSKSKYCSKRT